MCEFKDQEENFSYPLPLLIKFPIRNLLLLNFLLIFGKCLSYFIMLKLDNVKVCYPYNNAILINRLQIKFLSLIQ